MNPARARYDLDAIRARLTAEVVLDAYNPRQLRTGRRKGRCYRLADCLWCNGTSTRGAIAVYLKQGTWYYLHHGAECRGDMLDFVAKLEGIDIRREFARVVEIAAQLTGVSSEMPSADERLRRERERQERLRRDADEDHRADSTRRYVAREEWNALPQEHGVGRQYLVSRSLAPDTLAPHIRYSREGDICVRLNSLDDGELVTVTRRLLVGPAWDPTRKIHTPTGGTTRGTLCGRITDIDARDLVVTEGIVDTLTAIQLWPGSLVLGAAGAGQVPAVVAAAAPRVRAAGGRLLLVPDNDDIGQGRALEAGQRALDAGLAMDRTLLVVEVPEHDLNDSHCKGWRP